MVKRYHASFALGGNSTDHTGSSTSSETAGSEVVESNVSTAHLYAVAPGTASQRNRRGLGYAGSGSLTLRASRRMLSTGSSNRMRRVKWIFLTNTSPAWVTWTLPSQEVKSPGYPGGFSAFASTETSIPYVPRGTSRTSYAEPLTETSKCGTVLWSSLRNQKRGCVVVMSASGRPSCSRVPRIVPGAAVFC